MEKLHTINFEAFLLKTPTCLMIFFSNKIILKVRLKKRSEH